MSQPSALDRWRPPRPFEAALRTALFLLAMLVGGPLFVLGVVRFRVALPRLSWPVRLGATATGLVIFLAAWPALRGTILPLIGAAGAARPAAWYDLLLLWLGAVALVPLGAAVMSASDRLLDWARPAPLADRWRDRVAQEESARADAEAATGPMGRLPSPPPGVVRLGRLIGTSSFRPDAGVWRQGPWVGLEEHSLDHHALVVGMTGFGKTETLKRLIAEVLEHLPERDVFIVDGRGEPKFEEAVRDLAWHHRGIRARVCRLGTGEPGERYDAFRGDADAIYNRLLALVEVDRLEGNALYYGRMIRDVFGLACKAPDRGGPPRSFAALRERLTSAWLDDAWRHDPIERATVAGYRRKLPDVLTHLNSLARDLGPLIGPDGFALDSARVAVFSLRTMSAQDTAQGFLRLLIEDIKDWSGRRQQRPALLVVDEFAAFGISNIIDLLNQARSAKLGIVLATQSVSGLGEERLRDQILGVTGTKILLRTEQPEEIAALAGTVDQPEASFNYREGEMVQEGVVRFQQTFQVHPNEVGRLRKGECFVIRGRESAKLKVRAVDAVPTAPDEPTPPPPIAVLTPVEPAPAPPVPASTPAHPRVQRVVPQTEQPPETAPRPRRAPQVPRPDL